MELTPEQAMQLAYKKWMEVLEAVNHELTNFNEGREQQVTPQF